MEQEPYVLIADLLETIEDERMNNSGEVEFGGFHNDNVRVALAATGEVEQCAGESGRHILVDAGIVDLDVVR